MALEVNVTTGAWYGNEELTLNFPDSWDISVYESRDIEALDEPGIQKAWLLNRMEMVLHILSFAN